MTNRERLEWAASVLNREKWLGVRTWSSPLGVRWVFPGYENPDAGRMTAYAATAIALALDWQARRRLPEREQAEWAAGVLKRQGCDTTGWYDYHTLREVLAIAEAYFRDEMLSQETEEVSQ